MYSIILVIYLLVLYYFMKDVFIISKKLGGTTNTPNITFFIQLLITANTEQPSNHNQEAATVSASSPLVPLREEERERRPSHGKRMREDREPLRGLYSL